MTGPAGYGENSFDESRYSEIWCSLKASGIDVTDLVHRLSSFRGDKERIAP
jgi:hypothetical protein